MYSQSVVPNASRYTMSINLTRNVITHWFPVQFKTTLCAAEPISSNGWRLGGGCSGGQDNSWVKWNHLLSKKNVEELVIIDKWSLITVYNFKFMANENILNNASEPQYRRARKQVLDARSARHFWKWSAAGRPRPDTVSAKHALSTGHCSYKCKSRDGKCTSTITKVPKVFQ